MKAKNSPVVGIIGGKGQMGRWFARFFEQRGLDVLVSDQKTKLTNKQLAKKSDIVIICVPVRDTVKVIEEVISYVRQDALLADLTSVKTKPCAAMKKAKGGVLGMHPLFGAAVDNMEDQQIVFCPIRKNKWVGFLREIFTEAGAKIIETTSDEHDIKMALIQALTHFTNISFARTLQHYQFNLFKSRFSTPVFRLQNIIYGRVLSFPAELYADIEIENPYFHDVLQYFQKEVNSLASIVEQGDYKGFEKCFENTADSVKNFLSYARNKSKLMLGFLQEDWQQEQAQKEAKTKVVAYLGPEGTYSHETAAVVFSQSRLVPKENILNIFRAVEEGQAAFGVVPAENSTEGTIRETVDYLIDSALKVVGSYNLDIHHQLLGRTKNLKDIKVVKSHPHALAQCRQWLQKNLPKAELIPELSTTKAILVDQGKAVAFIASRVAAKAYGLKTLAENIEDQVDNQTRFFILAPEYLKKSPFRTKRILLVVSVYDRVGILRDILDVFARHNINLTKLESRPTKKRTWDYYFFFELQGEPHDPKIEKAFKELEEYCPFQKVLGVVDDR